jgi:MFS family permease
MMGVLLGVHLAKLQVGAALSGLIIGAGLAGAAGAALLATFAGDRWGRKRFLIGLAMVSAGGGVLFSLTRDPVFLAGAAFLGMVNGMGRDREAALILEQAILPGRPPTRDARASLRSTTSCRTSDTPWAASWRACRSPSSALVGPRSRAPSGCRSCFTTASRWRKSSRTRR